MSVVARLPGRIRFSYGLASIAGNAISQTGSLWLVYFYAPPSDATIAARVSDAGGIDARILLGATLTLARLIEALDDPLIGYWTDRTRSRWGRRLPFIVVFTPFWALFFVFFFLPPVAEASTANLVLLALAFYALSTAPLSTAPLRWVPELGGMGDSLGGGASCEHFRDR
jgi:glycoside/pentoside/hexuronide:cation symporter, GPH family